MRPLRVAAVFAAVFLASCSTSSPPPAHSALTFEGPPIRLDVARIEVVTEYTSPLRPPNVEHLMPIPPAMAAKRWAEQRLQPQGATRVAKVLIQDASVVEVPLKKTDGVRGFFTNDQAFRFDGKLSVTLSIVDDRAFGVGAATAEATRSQTLAEKASLNDRDQLYYNLSDQLVRDIDDVMARQIANNLARFLMR